MRPREELEAISWYWKNYQYVLAFLFAIEEINKSPHLLPNHSLGYDLYNTFPSDRRSLQGAVFGLSGGKQTLPNYNCQAQKQSVAILVGTTSALSFEIGTLLELYKIPQVTYGPFDPMLSDIKQFPSLYQMAPRDTFLTTGIVRLLLHFGWMWVALLVSDDIQGDRFLQDLKAKMVTNDICVAFTQKLPAITGVHTIQDIEIIISTAHVHILYGDLGSLLNIGMSTNFHLTAGKVWIMGNPSTSQWDVVFDYLDDKCHYYHGSLLFSDNKREIPGFRHFLRMLNFSQYPDDYYFTKFWIDQLYCSLSELHCGRIESCEPNSSLEFMPDKTDMMSVSAPSYFVYNAVNMVAHALHKRLLENLEVRSLGDVDQPIIPPWQLHPFLRKIQFTNGAGDNTSLDDKNNHVTQYDVQNLVRFPDKSWVLVKVGEFFSKSPHNQDLVINEEMIKWPVIFRETPQSVCTQKCVPGFRKTSQEGRPICCFLCVSCSETDISNQTDAPQCMQCPAQEYPNSERSRCLPKNLTFLGYEDALGMVLGFTALCLSLVTVVVFGVFVKHRDTPIVKANNRALSFILLISLLPCFLSSFLFIGRPNTATCILQQVTFALVFTVAISTVLAKTMTVILAFKATMPRRILRYLLLSGASNAVIPICSLIQVIICAIWLGSSPPFVDTDSHSEPRSLIIVCNKGSVTAFHCVLGYLGSLALGSFTVAFLARNLPDTFNEAKFLTFSMLLFCSVWVTFLPFYHSTKGKVMVAVEVFSILASSAGLLGCIFAPKCYIILVRPSKNSLKGFKKKKCQSK
ncbi:vomeronasal type-2 receptor 116-like [Tupaia chinensis]|uniref:vomeronasal type-2 receptor 116-like n=1 Tax=Tupaia chinensis TaxID=246437 RepID=UPI000FFBA01B|nr:vomeronasal type-2 receptor 116-like [Tupaia chinensis]